MASKEGKKDKENSIDVDILKSETVYGRLKRAYGLSSNKKLGERFGISKQAMGQRTKSGNWDPQEILDLFPDVNYEWVFSESLEDLRTLPVRQEQKESGGGTSTDEAKGRLSDDQVQVYLEQIESIVKTLKDNF